MNKIAELEALLFIAGEDGIEARRICELLEISSLQLQELLSTLQKKYQTDEASCFCLLEVEDRSYLATKENFAELLERYGHSPLKQKLSQAAVETLAIVAYRQPISRIEIEQIRGVQAASALNTLLNRSLITERGRMEGPGRAILYGTTQYFLDYFGLKDLTELPDVSGMEEEYAAALPEELFNDRSGEPEDNIMTEDE